VNQSPIVILVSGTRHATDSHRRIVTVAMAPFTGRGPVTLRHGAARGLDSIADDIAEKWGWELDPFPAAWADCGPGCPPRPHRKTREDRSYCPYAGGRRNDEMVATLPRPVLALAFPAVGSAGRGGTWQLIHGAADAGLVVRVMPLVVAKAVTR
jgi:hypothetical protein